MSDDRPEELSTAPQPPDGAMPPSSPDVVPVLGDDPRIVQMLSTEHWSVLSARSLAYNEAFTRAQVFLTFVSMSLVALALLAQGLSFSRDFLLIAAVVLGFDLLIGLTTYMRLMAAGNDDLRAMHGMSRIRHGYTQIAPTLTPYFSAPIHDDATGLMAGYGNPPPGGVGGVMYMLSTTLGMVGLIVCMLSGVAAGTVALAVGTSGRLALAAVPLTAVLFFVVLASWTARTIRAYQNALPVLFPSPAGGEQAG